MNDKKKTATKNQPEHIIRSGEVTAEIFLRQSNAGFTYLDYTLGRSWRSQSSGKEARGSSFFDKNEQDLTQVVREATAWIRAKVHSGHANPDSNAEGLPVE